MEQLRVQENGRMERYDFNHLKGGFLDFTWEKIFQQHSNWCTYNRFITSFGACQPVLI